MVPADGQAKQLQRKLVWVRRRLVALDKIEGKLKEMRFLAEAATERNWTEAQRQDLDRKVQDLQQEVLRLDKQSRTYRLA